MGYHYQPMSHPRETHGQPMREPPMGYDVSISTHGPSMGCRYQPMGRPPMGSMMFGAGYP